MFVVEYARAGDFILGNQLKGYLCHYLFCEDHEPWICNRDRLHSYLPIAKDGTYTYLASNVRVPEMDAKVTIRNRFAYVNLVLRYVKTESVADFIRSILLVRERGLPSYVEDVLWQTAPPAIKQWFQGAIRIITTKLAAKMYAPDYVWKSRGCKTTLQLMQERWDRDKKVLMGLA
jgi:hypothetical protein